MAESEHGVSMAAKQLELATSNLSMLQAATDVAGNNDNSMDGIIEILDDIRYLSLCQAIQSLAEFVLKV